MIDVTSSLDTAATNKTITVGFILLVLNHLQLNIQSVLDASLPNKQQHKAASSMVLDLFQKTLDQICYEWTGINKAVLLMPRPEDAL